MTRTQEGTLCGRRRGMWCAAGGEKEGEIGGGVRGYGTTEG